jgi:very-short-patch-repair endonuclease/predicted transcriptional regulator of viral defense system
MRGGTRNGPIRDGIGSTPLDRAIAQLAKRQHGVVSLKQLDALGLRDSGTRKRVAAGRLHRIHRGVYSVGHSLLKVEGRWMAAVLSFGVAAVLSHRSAAELWDLRRAGGSVIDVTVPRTSGHSRDGITVHRVRDLVASDVTCVRGIPCTTVSRTLLDLADVLSRPRLERVVAQAEVMGTFDLNALKEVLERSAGRRGSGKLRTLLDEYEEGTALTQSKLEELMLGICINARVKRPEVNQWIVLDDSAVQVDLLWRKQKLIVEVDGHRFHGNRRAFEQDRERDQRLVLAGHRVVRFTWRQITREPEKVGRRIAEMLRGPPPSLPKET